MTDINSTHELAVLKTDSRGRVWTPPQRREALLDAFEQSGMSGAKFARLHGIKYPTFANWRQARNRERLQETPDALFEELHVHSQAAGLTVSLPGGASVRLERADQFPIIAALLSYLEHAC